MTLTAYVGKKHGLVFPVMSNGYIKIPFDSQVRGFWDHNDSFTIETVVTPYDVNGYGEERDEADLDTNYAASVSSKKVMPSLDKNTRDTSPTTYQDLNYITYADRFTHKMMLFSNSKVQLYLQNTTTTNHNQPADYKVVFKVITSGSTTTIESDALISPRTTGYYNITDGVYTATNDELKYVPVTNDGSTKLAISSRDSTSQITVGDTAEEYVAVNQKLYTSAGVLIGTVSNLSSATVTFSPTEVPASGVSGNVYTEAPKQAIYTESIFHIAATFDKVTGDMCIYINGVQVKVDTHANPDTFDWGQVDSYIGQDASLAQSISKTTPEYWLDGDGVGTQVHGTFSTLTNQGDTGGTFIAATVDGSDVPLLDYNNTLNGYPILDFEDAGLKEASSGTLTLDTNYDIVMVVQNSGDDCIVLGDTGAGSHVIKFVGRNLVMTGASGTITSTNDILPASGTGFSIIRIQKVGSTAYYSCNGNRIETDTVSGLGALTINSIGCETADPSGEANTHLEIAAMIISEDSVFTTTYATELLGFLSNKYNVPSTHNPWENAYRKTSRNTQFMGQLHDFSITKGARKTFDTLYTLTPRQKDTLLYYRFEEVKNQ